MEVEVRLPRLHEGQRRVLVEARRWNVLACGRRWGKTVLGRDLTVRSALKGDSVAWGAPGYRYLAESYRELKQCLGKVVTEATENRRLELLGGGHVDFWSLNDKDAGRGSKYNRWIIDEAAMVKGLGTVFMEAIRPTLSDLQGDAWFLSTPKGRGFFWEGFRLGIDELEQDWQSWQMPSSWNPKMLIEEIESAKGMLPDRVFRQEYLAEFVEDEERVFRNVRVAVDVGRSLALPVEDGRRYQAGVDLARLRLRESGIFRGIGVHTLLPGRTATSLFNGIRGAFNDELVTRYREFCDGVSLVGYDPVVGVDSAPFVADTATGTTGTFVDALHPNDYGQRMVARYTMDLAMRVGGE